MPLSGQHITRQRATSPFQRTARGDLVEYVLRLQAAREQPAIGALCRSVATGAQPGLLSASVSTGSVLSSDLTHRFTGWHGRAGQLESLHEPQACRLEGGVDAIKLNSGTGPGLGH
jgi:hypothetical protein